MQSVCIVDGSFLYHAAQTVDRNLKIDHVKFLRMLRNDSTRRGLDFQQAHFFVSVNGDQSEGSRSFQNYLQRMEPEGPHYSLHKYPTKLSTRNCKTCGDEYTAQTESGVDCGIVINMIKMASKGRIRHVYLCAGDADFLEAIEYLKSTYGITFTLVGAKGCIAASLQSAVDEIIFVEKCLKEIIDDRDRVPRKTSEPVKSHKVDAQPATAHPSDNALNGDDVLTVRGGGYQNPKKGNEPLHRRKHA